MTPEDFDESDQAGLLSQFKLPDDWYDNRPFEEKFSNFGILIPDGLPIEQRIKLPYDPKKSKSMTPEEKAQQIADRFRVNVVMWSGGVTVENENVKQCAFIVVDEVLKEMGRVGGYNVESETDDGISCSSNERIEYWQSVKQAILKIK